MVLCFWLILIKNLVLIHLIVSHCFESMKLQLEHNAFCISYCKCWIRLISQLINCISTVLQKLIGYFNGTNIPTSFDSSFRVWSGFFCLNLNEAVLLWSVKSIIPKQHLKLVHLYSISWCFQIIITILSLYSIKLYIGITTPAYLFRLCNK